MRVTSKSKKESGYIFSGEEIRNISALADTLQKIRARLTADGISIEDERAKLFAKLFVRRHNINNTNENTSRRRGK